MGEDLRGLSQTWVASLLNLSNVMVPLLTSLKGSEIKLWAVSELEFRSKLSLGMSDVVCCKIWLPCRSFAGALFELNVSCLGKGNDWELLPSDLLLGLHSSSSTILLTSCFHNPQFFCVPLNTSVKWFWHREYRYLRLRGEGNGIFQPSSRHNDRLSSSTILSLRSAIDIISRILLHSIALYRKWDWECTLHRST